VIDNIVWIDASLAVKFVYADGPKVVKDGYE
jgi:hypothetical protein